MSEPAGRGAFWTEQRALPANRRNAPRPGPRSRSSVTREDSGLQRPGGERDRQGDQGGRQPLPRADSPVRRPSTADRRRPRYLRLVADGGRLVPQPPGQPARVRHEPVRPAASRRAVASPRAAAPPRPVAPRQAAARTPVRLTRRGRLVVTAAAVLIVGAVSMAVAGVAQATGHSAATAAHAREGVTKVLVRPGQNLWSLAERYAPGADTRLVIQEILQLNSMSTDQVQPGQVLWVPRG
jgi:nucleoid-associated protein YgaU